MVPTSPGIENVLTHWSVAQAGSDDEKISFDCPFKGAVSRDFQTLFFSLIEPIWALDKQAQIVFLKIRFHEDIRI